MTRVYEVSTPRFLEEIWRRYRHRPGSPYNGTDEWRRRLAHAKATMPPDVEPFWWLHKSYKKSDSPARKARVVAMR